MRAASYREEIYDTFADSADIEAQFQRALDTGTEYLGLPLGVVTRIRDGTQEILHAVGDDELIRPGATCPLDRAYCRRTVETVGTLAVEDARAASAITDEAVRTFEMGTYIGAKIVVNDGIYGTVCFAADDDRDTPFSEAENVFVELLARLVGQRLEREEYERELRDRNARLRREKRRFEGIAETSFDILFRIGLSTEFTYVSSAIERILAYDPDEMLGTSFTSYLTGPSAADALDAFERVLADEAIEQLQLDFVHADGGIVTLEVNGTAICRGGEVVGGQGVARDITARKEREEELRIKNRAIAEAQVGISIADGRDPERPLVYVNGGFERVTGYDADVAVGRSCRFLQGPSTDPESVDRMHRAIDAAQPVSVELLNYRRDGAPFWNQVKVGPIENESGDVTHYLGFQEDITERKRSGQLIQLLNRVLRHNLRNDMNTILGYGDMLRDASGEEVAAYGKKIGDTARGLVALSERAQKLERHARQERDPRRLDLDDLLGGVADDYRGQFPAATVDLRIETDRGICAGRELERAVSELVENGLKHHPGDAPDVEISAVDDGEWIELTVADDGPGIDEMEAAVISAGRETALEHGSGLGMWLVNWIVTRYGGSFQIRAEDDGSVATIRLPGIDAETPVDAVARRPTVLFQ